MQFEFLELTPFHDVNVRTVNKKYQFFLDLFVEKHFTFRTTLICWNLKLRQKYVENMRTDKLVGW